MIFGMFVRQCNTTGAFGCYALSRMHAEGRGILVGSRSPAAWEVDIVRVSFIVIVSGLAVTTAYGDMGFGGPSSRSR